ncbi:MAG: hypothetical protein E7384_05930 [Ruminococcaceae bacterium]|nr:hypothetical protein [Oscillospiraceae bacterium]
MLFVLKSAGAVLIASSGIMTGYKLKKRLQMRRDILAEYRAGIEFTESRISLDELALEECMNECRQRFCKEYPEYNLFSIFGDKLSQGILSGEEAWRDTVESVSEKGLLSDGEINLLCSLSSTLGRADVKHHSEHLKTVAEKLDLLITEADVKLKKDGNLFIKLGAAASAVLILLLW